MSNPGRKDVFIAPESTGEVGRGFAKRQRRVGEKEITAAGGGLIAATAFGAISSISKGDNMIHNVYAGGPANLREERKTNWMQKTLNVASLFYHGGPMSPGSVLTTGLDAVTYRAEYVVDNANANPIGGGKLIFSFLVAPGTFLPINFDKSAAVRRLWGEAGHGYIFEAPVNTTFYSSGANQPVPGQEIAFPYHIVSADLRYYCAPDVRGMHGGPQRRFQIVPWQAVVNQAIVNANLINLGL